MKNAIPFIFCLIGGILLFLSSWQGDVGLLAIIITYVAANFPESAPILETVFRILLWIAGLGGIAVIIGALLLVLNRVRLGKFLIGLGVGIGFIGVLILLGTTFVTGGLDALVSFVTLVSQSLAWIGIIMTIIGRRTVKKD